MWFHNTQNNNGLTPKLQQPWQGPYVVTKKINDLVYCIQLGLTGSPRWYTGTDCGASLAQTLQHGSVACQRLAQQVLPYFSQRPEVRGLTQTSSHLQQQTAIPWTQTAAHSQEGALIEMPAPALWFQCLLLLEKATTKERRCTETLDRT